MDKNDSKKLINLLEEKGRLRTPVKLWALNMRNGDCLVLQDDSIIFDIDYATKKGDRFMWIEYFYRTSQSFPVIVESFLYSDYESIRNTMFINIDSIDNVTVESFTPQGFFRENAQLNPQGVQVISSIELKGNAQLNKFRVTEERENGKVLTEYYSISIDDEMFWMAESSCKDKLIYDWNTWGYKKAQGADYNGKL